MLVREPRPPVLPVLLLCSLVACWRPGRALVAKPPTPILGFSTWNCFKGAINETEMRAVCRIAAGTKSPTNGTNVCMFVCCLLVSYH